MPSRDARPRASPRARVLTGQTRLHPCLSVTAVIQHKHTLRTTARTPSPTYTHGGGASNKEDGTDGDVGEETIFMMTLVLMMMTIMAMVSMPMIVHMVMVISMVMLTMVLPARARHALPHAFAAAAAAAPHTPSVCDAT